MALNKKQKKQIDAARKKIHGLQQLLTAARQQPDDPQEIPRLQAQIEELERQIKTIQEG
jgi:transcriptional/translational regulatory protein YebC/TACO1